MNCFNEEYIQKIVDSECSNMEQEQFELHVAKCSKCLAQYKLQQNRSVKIKNEINSLIESDIDVPEFKMNGVSTKESIPFKRKLIYVFAAASVLLFVLMLGKYNVKTCEDEMVYYNLEFEFDANKPLSDQDMVMYFTDEKGNTYENGLN